MFRVICPSCQAQFKGEQKHVGRHVKCPKCGHAFTVTAPSSARAGEEASQRLKSETSKLEAEGAAPVTEPSPGPNGKSGGARRRRPLILAAAVAGVALIVVLAFVVLPSLFGDSEGGDAQGESSDSADSAGGQTSTAARPSPQATRSIIAVLNRFRQLIDDDSNKSRAQFFVAAVHAANGDVQAMLEATPEGSSANELNELDELVSLRQIDAGDRRGAIATADRMFERARKMYEASNTSLKMRSAERDLLSARAIYTMAHHRPGVDAVDSAIPDIADRLDAKKHLSALVRGHRIDDALTFFETIQLPSVKKEVRLDLAQQSERAGNVERALGLYADVIAESVKAYPRRDEYDDLFRATMSLLRLRRFDTVLASFSQLRPGDPLRRPILNAVVLTQADSVGVEQAIATARAHGDLMLVAEVQLRAGDTGAAVQNLRAVSKAISPLEKEPTVRGYAAYLDARRRLRIAVATMQAAAGDREGAELTLTEPAVKGGKIDWEEAGNVQAWTLLQSGELKRAVLALRDPSHDAIYSFAEAALKAGSPREALFAFAQYQRTASDQEAIPVDGSATRALLMRAAGAVGSSDIDAFADATKGWGLHVIAEARMGTGEEAAMAITLKRFIDAALAEEDYESAVRHAHGYLALRRYDDAVEVAVAAARSGQGPAFRSRSNDGPSLTTLLAALTHADRVDDVIRVVESAPASIVQRSEGTGQLLLISRVTEGLIYPLAGLVKNKPTHFVESTRTSELIATEIRNAIRGTALVEDPPILGATVGADGKSPSPGN